MLLVLVLCSVSGARSGLHPSLADFFEAQREETFSPNYSRNLRPITWIYVDPGRGPLICAWFTG